MCAQNQLALITTQAYLKQHPTAFAHFVYQRLYALSLHQRLLCSAETYQHLMGIVTLPYAELDLDHASHIAHSMGTLYLSGQHYRHWQDHIQRSLTTTQEGAAGMVDILYDLAEGHLSGVIHLTLANEAESDNDALWQATNVHEVPIAHDLASANQLINTWLTDDSQHNTTPPIESSLSCIKKNDRVLALIAHEGQNADIRAFAQRVADNLLDYDVILATGSTGGKLLTALKDKVPAEALSKIRPCLSGPLGGDLQVAYAMLHGMCSKVMLFQDKNNSQSQQDDHYFFERVLLGSEYPVERVSNTTVTRIVA